MKRARHKQGSVVFDKRRRTWNFLFCENGVRRTKLIGSAREFPTKTSAWQAAEAVRHSMDRCRIEKATVTISDVVEQYRTEKMPQRYSTRRAYECWLRKHILPRWAQSHLIDLQARPVELWLHSLSLSAKSKSHIKGLLRILWDYAMWRRDVPTQRNPMELVTITGVSKRTRMPRSLSVEEFQRFSGKLSEPFLTISLLCVSFGLRISECLALKWLDIDWGNGKLSVQRGIVRQRVGEVKTIYSQRKMPVDSGMLAVLKNWRECSQFVGDEDWVFASPTKLGRQPWSYDQVWRMFLRAAERAEIGRLGTHSMRHTYRSWLDAVGTGIAVQQKLMRHADIRTTMNVYGDVVTSEMAEAHSKVAGLALSRVN